MYKVIRDASLDELVLDFDNLLSAATPFHIESNVHGLNLLKAIDEQLDKISGWKNEALRTEDAFYTDEK